VATAPEFRREVPQLVPAVAQEIDPALSTAPPEPGDPSSAIDTAIPSPPVPTPVLTLTQSAHACRVSRITIRRYLEAGRLPNAFKAHDGAWRIPVTDLISAGLRPIRAVRADEPLVHRLALELDRLRSENAMLRERLISALAIAHERELAIADLRFAMRMLPEAWAEKLARGDRERLALGEGPPAPQTRARGTSAEPAASRPSHRSAIGGSKGPIPPTPEAAEPSAEVAPTAPGGTDQVQQLEEELSVERAERDRLVAELSRPRRWWQRLRRPRPESLASSP
jgi:hypothetical protein